jgi:protein MpaA
VFPTVPPPFSPTPNPQQAAGIANADAVLDALPAAFRFGQSVNGADLLAYRHGRGDRVIMLVGGIHMGYESITVDLVRELREFFRDRPQEIVPGITLIFVPSINPDAAAYGDRLRGRFNANEVDLNRNWGCGWSSEAVFQDREVNPGSEPFSEPETRALGSLIQRVQPDAVMFYHAAANGVYSGSCNPGSTVSDELAEVYGTASRYPFGSEFSAYVVTGTAPAWVDSLGIPALDVELATSDSTEFQRNLNGLMAVQRWLARDR